MKMQVVTTITTLLDIDTMQQEVSVDIDDQDGLSEVSGQVLGSVLIGSCRSVERGLRKQFHIPDSVGQREHQPITEDEEV